jgi:DNA-binding NtrC family response regulator
LNSVPIHLPPLRKRKEDIPLLAEHFLQRFRDEHGKEVRGFGLETVALLVRYDWPSNVRELENVVQRAGFTAAGDTIQPSDLPPELTGESVQGSGDVEALETAVTRVVEHLWDAPPPGGVYHAVIDRVERVLVERAVERARGIRVRAARLLGINRNTLYAKVERGGTS